MLTISKPIVAGQAEKYFEREFAKDYYLESDTIGSWWGEGAAKLGLEGGVREEEFVALVHGQDPRTGRVLVHGSNRAAGKRRAGYDLTFSAPKSVSLVALAGDDRRLVAAHNRAVTAALREIESYARGRGSTPDGPHTRNLVVARFLHETSRELDPQLHTHCVTLNLTSAGAKWTALNSQTLYQLQRYGTAVYRAHLAEEVQRLGYTLTPGKRGAWEIAGISGEQLTHFSRRRRQIEEALREQGKTGAAAAEVATRSTRGKKKHLNEATIRAGWLERAAEVSLDAHQVRTSADPSRYVAPSEEKRRAQASKAMDYAVEHATERDSVTRQHALRTYALEHSMGRITLADTKSQLCDRVARSEIIELVGAPPDSVTSREILTLEHRLIHLMREGRGTRAAIDEAPNFATLRGDDGRSVTPTDQQRLVAAAVLASRDLVMGVQGKAGTGKTFTIDSIRQLATRKGYSLIGLAPTTGAVEALGEAGVQARTVASFLAERTEAGKNQLWIVDEASFLHTRDAHKLLVRAREAGARVVLIGDTNSRRSRSAGQLHAVEAGSPFRLLQDARMETVELAQIQRQKREDLRLAVEAASRGNAAEAVERIAAMGNVFEFKKPEDRLRAIAKDYVSDPKGALVLAPSNRERQELNRLIREELARGGTLPEGAVRIECLKPKDVTKPGMRLAESYSRGDVVTFRSEVKHPAIGAGTKARVVDVDIRRNAVTVEIADGGRRAFDPKGLRGLDLYEPETRAFAPGDRVQFRKPVEIPGEQRIRNGALATVVSIHEGGHAVLRLDSRRVVRLDLRSTPYLDHGYAVTTHKAQGATCHRVILAANTKESKLLLNQAQTYVALSRARYDARIYTDRADALPGRAERRIEKSNALDYAEVSATRDSSISVG